MVPFPPIRLWHDCFFPCSPADSPGYVGVPFPFFSREKIRSDRLLPVLLLIISGYPSLLYTFLSLLSSRSPVFRFTTWDGQSGAEEPTSSSHRSTRLHRFNSPCQEKIGIDCSPPFQRRRPHPSRRSPIPAWPSLCRWRHGGEGRTPPLLPKGTSVTE
jgi:hypothetical protein